MKEESKMIHTGPNDLADNDSNQESGDDSQDDDAINEVLVGKGLGNCL